MHLGRIVPAKLLALLLANPVAEALQDVVLGLQSGDAVLHVLRQVGVERRRVGEQGVASRRRQLARPQHAGERRLLAEGHVGVPFVRRAGERQDLLGYLQAVGRLDVQNLGMAGHGRRHRVPLQFAEIAAEADVVLVADVLIAEEQHLMAKEPGAERFHRFGGQRPAQIDAGHLGAQHGSGRREGRPGQIEALGIDNGVHDRVSCFELGVRPPPPGPGARA